jgi:hypothetical protein
MQFLNVPIRTFFEYREERFVNLYEHAIESQEKWFRFMVEYGSRTEFGKEFHLEPGMSYQEFSERVPVNNYNSLYPYIDRLISGEQDLLWPTHIEWLAKSSGTTQGKSKYIPVSSESLKENNIISASDCLTFYVHLFPETEIFGGKTITLGGSFQSLGRESALKCGDISAILMENMPAIGLYLKAPNSKEILLHSNWNEKLKLIAQNTANENITAISGVPSWMLLVMKEVLHIKGKQFIHEVWPNLEVFFHGGVSFAPYREEYKKMFSLKEVFFMNIYNASEGFFGIQNERNSDDMLLLTDNCVFYEFKELNDSSNESKVVSLADVELDKVYALVITTAAGLWRYEIGDTIQFTSLRPYKFKISGRTTHYINAFGEEVVVDNAEKAVTEACLKTGAIISNFTAAPIFLGTEKSKGGHEWAIEFTQHPSDIDLFSDVLDQALKNLNSDYEAKRTGDLMLIKPKISVVATGTFIKWLGSKNKLGGQHKVPRLQNDRKLIEEILNFSNIISHSNSL